MKSRKYHHSQVTFRTRGGCDFITECGPWPSPARRPPPGGPGETPNLTAVQTPHLISVHRGTGRGLRQQLGEPRPRAALPARRPAQHLSTSGSRAQQDCRDGTSERPCCWRSRCRQSALSRCQDSGQTGTRAGVRRARRLLCALPGTMTACPHRHVDGGRGDARACFKYFSVKGSEGHPSFPAPTPLPRGNSC